MALVAPDLPPSVYHDEALAEADWANGWQTFVLERERAQVAERAQHRAAAIAPSDTAAPWRKNLRNQLYPEHYVIGALVSGAFLMAGSALGWV